MVLVGRFAPDHCYLLLIRKDQVANDTPRLKLVFDGDPLWLKPFSDSVLIAQQCEPFIHCNCCEYSDLTDVLLSTNGVVHVAWVKLRATAFHFAVGHKTTIFFSGATGYIGGTVLTRFIQHPNASNFDITVLVRSADKAKKLESFGLKAVVGSLQDLDQLESLASQADVIISCADADDLPAITAIVNGMKKRHDASGFAPIVIHTSGTAKLYWKVLTDHAAGMFASDAIYYDTDPDQIETLAPMQVHRNVDLMIVDADAKGHLKSYIILPSTIFGIATARGQAGMIGEGKNIWPDVHIDESHCGSVSSNF
ncbi:Uncharacterized protein C2A9.02 [Grifola frondosa]|uniref:Uncharacterized protein C2A9.02 n=1 Tax=Grifola frondosa TaxID=5627 RepID=A0A1C7M5N9_GRIFR|nr:Uncharacterized protein C2A9.02 [Grifola frondosa]